MRSPLVNDAIAAGTVPDPPTAPGEPANAHETVISYETPADGSYAMGQVASVTAPTASDTAAAWGARQEHSYAYSPAGPGPATTTVVVAGETTASGSARQVSFDGGGFMTKDVGADGVAVGYTWDDATQQELTETDHHAPTGAGLETTWAYDPEGRQTDKWGPAPPSCFSGVAGNSSDTYYEPNGTCTPAPPHTRTGYDEAIGGLAAAWYGGTSTDHPAAFHTLVPGYFTGAPVINGPAPPSWSGYGASFTVVLTGWLTVPANGPQLLLAQTSDGGATVYVDGQALDNEFGTCGPGYLSGGLIAPGTHQLEVTFGSGPDDGSSTPQLTLWWATLQVQACSDGSGSAPFPVTQVPTSDLDPGYDYVTSTQTDNAGTGTSNALVQYTYGDPAHGLKTQQVVDPAGQDLVTKYSYEGTSGFYDPSGTTLPAGGTTTGTYYNGTDAPVTATDPCVAGSPALDQGDNMYQQATPGRTQTYVYDTAGHVLASRESSSDAWTCSSYDARGRPTQVSYPAFGGTPAYTDTYSYAVDGDPLVTSVTKAVPGGPATTVTTTTDLLGRTVSYTDAEANTTTTSYDQAGRTTGSCMTPSGSTSCASTLATSYDSSGRVAADAYNGATADAPTYDAYSNLSGATYGNGTSLTYSYDSEGRLDAEGFAQAGGATLLSDSNALSQPATWSPTRRQAPRGRWARSATPTTRRAGSPPRTATART
jgi:YD repeat-containing protein